MSISQKLENCYKNQIENIKNEKNYISRTKQVGALVLDVGGRCISSVAKEIGSCRKYVRKCADIVSNNLLVETNKNKCGRKKITDKYPELKQDITIIMDNNAYTNSHFETEKLISNLTIDEIMVELLKTGKYSNKFISRSSLANLLNEMGYTLKRVKRNKPLKKIKETDSIFENVHKNKFHKEIRKIVPTLNCQRCNHEKFIPKKYFKN